MIQITEQIPLNSLSKIRACLHGTRICFLMKCPSQKFSSHLLCSGCSSRWSLWWVFGRSQLTPFEWTLQVKNSWLFKNSLKSLNLSAGGTKPHVELTGHWNSEQLRLLGCSKIKADSPKWPEPCNKKWRKWYLKTSTTTNLVQVEWFEFFSFQVKRRISCHNKVTEKESSTRWKDRKYVSPGKSPWQICHYLAKKEMV